MIVPANWVNRGMVVALDKRCFDYSWPRQMFNKLQIRYYMVGTSLAGYVAYSFPTTQIREIKRIGVLPQYRRRGFGTELLHYIRQEANGERNTFMTVFVDERNDIALRFFSDYGFTSKLVRNPGDTVDSVRFNYKIA